MIRSRSILSLLLLSILHSGTTKAEEVAVEVTPNINFIVPVTSPKNITYDCATTPGTQPFWSINTVQLMNPNDSIAVDFANLGISIEIITSNITRLTITPEGRVGRLQGGSINTINCVCMGIIATGIVDPNVAVTVTTYNRPDPPGNLTLDSIEESLMLVWERPGNAPTISNTTYNISIFNVTESAGDVLYAQVSGQSETSYSIHSLEESLQGMPCQEFRFIVVAQNDAGVGITSIYNETVPLSANTSEIDATLKLVSLELGEGNNVTIEIEFRAVNSCSDRFPVVDYTFNLNSRPASVVPASSLEPLTLVRVVLDSRNLSTPVFHNRPYALSVTVRSAVSERTSRTALFIQTTDVQSAEVIFYENNVLLRCTLANRTLSRGCIFRFSSGLNETDEFVLPREADEMSLSLCNTTLNRRSAYTRISVFDIESDGNVGSFRIRPVISELRNRTDFTRRTGCELPSDEITLPPEIDVPAIVVPIVVPIVVVVLILLGIGIAVIIVAVYHLRKKKRKLVTTRRDLDETTQQLTEERNKPARKPSLTPSENGHYVGVLDPGNLLGPLNPSHMTASPSSHSDVSAAATPTTPPPDQAQGGPPPLSFLPVPEHSTGSTSSYSPPRDRAVNKSYVRRSLSEPGATDPLIDLDELSNSKGMLKVSLTKDSMKVQVKRDQLINQLRKNRRQKLLKNRSKSVGSDMSGLEEEAPLLTLSEIEVSFDVLQAISEEELESLIEESGDHSTSPFKLHITPSPSTTPHDDSDDVKLDGMDEEETTC